MSDTFLTGGTGFIGGALLRRLLADGRSVRALVRSPGAAAEVEGMGARSVVGDLRSPGPLRAAMEGCTTVFHVAGMNAMCLRDRTALDATNVDGTRAVIEAAAGAGVGRVVYTSSAATIGEPVGTVGNEWTTHRGAYDTAYERSKHRAELAAVEAGERCGVEVVAVNPSSVQGPGRTTGTARILIGFLTGRLRLAVDTRLSAVFIDDVVLAHLEAERQGKAGQRYLISGWSVPVTEAIAVLSTVTGIERRVRLMSPWVLDVAGRMVGTGAWLLRRDAPLCPEMVRALRHGHTYDGSRVVREWGFEYTRPEIWLAETVAWYRTTLGLES